MAFFDFFKDLKDNVLERMRNPFILTFIISWLAHNWLLVYEIYYFDESSRSLGSRIDIIARYVDLHKCNNLTILPLFWSLGAILVYLLFSNIGLFLFSSSDRYIKPIIYKLTNKSRLVTKEIHEDLLGSYENVKKQNDDLLTRESKLLRELEQHGHEKESLYSKVSELESQNKQLVLETKTLSAEKVKWQDHTFSVDDGIQELNRVFRGLRWNYFTTDNIHYKPELKCVFIYNNGILYVDEKPIYDLVDIKINDTKSFVELSRVNHENRNILQKIRLIRITDSIYRGAEFRIDHNTIEHLDREVIFSSSNLKTEELAAINSFKAITSELTIVSALYGKNETYVNVTDLLNKKIENSTLSITVDNNIAGDPLPGFLKEMKIVYSFKGQLHFSLVDEGTKLILP
jgi:hypothetical protein